MSSKVSGAYSRVGVDAPTPAGHVRVNEGHAVVMMPPAAVLKETGSAAVGDDTSTPPAIFYNKAQVVNRDLSVCVLETFSKLRAAEPRKKGGTGDDGITVLEALSATGLRALRYWHEVEGIRHVIANDLDAEAVECIRNNCKINDVPVVSVADFNALSWQGAPSQAERRAASEAHAARIKAAPKGIVPTCSDAIVLMRNLGLDPEKYAGQTLLWKDNATGETAEVLQKQEVDVIDLDPYGTASPFLDSCVGCAKEGALLLVTCTDSAILCGNYAETCHAKYNSVSARLSACHEMAARIVLASIERAANKHGKYIEPLLSLHIDFYVRVFVRIRTQPAEVKLSVSKLANVFHCVDCPAYFLRPVARIRRAKNYKDDGTQTNNKSHRREGRDEARREAQVALDEDASANIDPVSYPATPSRSLPIHCTSTLVDDVPRRCHVCSGRMAIAGPIYAAPSQDPAFIEQVLATLTAKGRDKLKAFDRVQGLLQTAKGELPDAPLFYRVPDFASLLKMHVPPNPVIIGALSRKGYACSQVHCDASGLKTTAPPHALAAVLLAYRNKVWIPSIEQEAKDGEEATNVNPVPTRIKVPEMPDCDFTYDKMYDTSSRATGVAKFIPNPAFWGPRAKHVGVASAPSS